MHVKIIFFVALFLAFLLSLALCSGPSADAPGDFMDTVFVYREPDPARFDALRDEIMNRERISGQRFMELAQGFTLDQYLALFGELAREELGVRVTGWEQTTLGWKLGLEGEVDGNATRGHVRFLLTAGSGFAPGLGEEATAVYAGELQLGDRDLSEHLPLLYREAFLRYLESL